MPRRPRKHCNYPGCPELIEPTETYCKYHKALKTQQMNSRRTDKESKSYYRLAHWRKLRAQVLREEPLCRECYRKGIITLATEVDHIDGNRHNLARENLQPLCRHHHSQKTVREQGGFGNKKKSLSADRGRSRLAPGTASLFKSARESARCECENM